MDTLVMMNAPGRGRNVSAATDILQSIVDARPGITWGELAAAARADTSVGLAGPGGMDGWLTTALRKAGKVGDAVTFGAASPVLIGLRDIGASVFSKKKVSDSLKEAGRGVFDDAFGRFLDALPFGIGKDFKTGYVVNRYWLVGMVVVGGVLLLMWLRPGGRR